MKKNTLKQLVVMFMVGIMAMSMIPAIPAEAASTNSTIYRRAKSMQEKLTNLAEYYGYYSEVYLSSNSKEKVTWTLRYDNTENYHFSFVQETTKKNGKFKTVYKNGGKSYSYASVVRALKDYQTRDGYAMLDVAAELADELVEEAERWSWTCSEFVETPKKHESTVSFKATNRSNQSYTISVIRRAEDQKVETIYKLNTSVYTKEDIIASLKKYR